MWKSTSYASWYNKITASFLRILLKCINHEETSDKPNLRAEVAYTPHKYQGYERQEDQRSWQLNAT